MHTQWTLNVNRTALQYEMFEGEPKELEGELEGHVNPHALRWGVHREHAVGDVWSQCMESVTTDLGQDLRSPAFGCCDETRVPKLNLY